MKWHSAPEYLRRLSGVPREMFERIHRLDAASVMVPLIDLATCLAASRAGLSAGRAQLAGFLAVAALSAVLRRYARLAGTGRSWSLRQLLHWIVVTLLALCLRIGVFALLYIGWGRTDPVAFLFAVIATTAVMRPGYAYCVEFPVWRLGASAGGRELAVGVIALALSLRLIYSGQVQLLPEEAYYWNYSRHLDFGYLDHPPMVAWLIGLGTAGFGDTEFGVRIGALCCGAIGSYFTYRLTRNLFGSPSALVAVVLAQTLPFFFLAGMLMTPDAPLTAAWVAALYFLERALIGGRRAAWWWAGACLGLGLLSKYSIGLLVLSTFIFMLLDAPSRRWFARLEPYGAALLAFALFSPVIVWNAHNEWASFAFQTSRRFAEKPRFALHELIACFFVLLTPTGFAATSILLQRRAPGRLSEESSQQRRAWRFLRVSVGVPLAVFAAFSLRHEVKLDWTGAPWIAAVPAMAAAIVYCGENRGKRLGAWIRASWTPTLVAMLLIYGAGLYYVAAGIPAFGYSKHMELTPVGWQDFAAQINEIAQATEKAGGEYPLIVGMDRYEIASELAFYSPDHVKSVAGTSSAHLFGRVGLMYERWYAPDAQRGRTLLLVAWNRADIATDRVQPSVERLQPISEGALTRDNHVIRTYYYRLAYGYRGYPPP